MTCVNSSTLRDRMLFPTKCGLDHAYKSVPYLSTAWIFKDFECYGNDYNNTNKIMGAGITSRVFQAVLPKLPSAALHMRLLCMYVK